MTATGPSVVERGDDASNQPTPPMVPSPSGVMPTTSLPVTEHPQVTECSVGSELLQLATTTAGAADQGLFIQCIPNIPPPLKPCHSSQQATYEEVI